MKKLYAYTDRTESKIDYMSKIFEQDDKAAMLTMFDGDPYEMTLEDIVLKYLECVFGIPASVCKKPLVELTETDIAILENVEKSMICFSRN